VRHYTPEGLLSGIHGRFAIAAGVFRIGRPVRRGSLRLIEQGAVFVEQRMKHGGLQSKRRDKVRPLIVLLYRGFAPSSRHGPRGGKQMKPDRALDAIETASRDEIVALQTERLR
jgi:hypothetical protein